MRKSKLLLTFLLVVYPLPAKASDEEKNVWLGTVDEDAREPVVKKKRKKSDHEKSSEPKSTGDAIKLQEKNQRDVSQLVDLVRLLVQVDAAKNRPKQSVTLKFDADLYENAQQAFGDKLGVVLEAALLEALEQRKKAMEELASK